MRACVLPLVILLTEASEAAELKIMTPRAMRTVLKEIGPEFERSSGYKLNVVTDTAATLADRIIDGEDFDIFVGPPAQMNRVVQANKVITDTRTPIAYSELASRSEQAHLSPTSARSMHSSERC